ncbi:UNVERIFIED_CONTAM: hypothetical protein NCL1_40775 [Trichonephila clavipes]
MWCSVSSKEKEQLHHDRDVHAPSDVRTKKRSVSESVRNSLKLLNDSGHRVISKIVTGDETYKPLFDVPTRQESKLWVFEDDPTPTMVKSHRAMKKVMYAVFFRSTGLIKSIQLEGQKTITANWYTTKGLSEILQEFNVRGLMLHHNNGTSHRAGLTAEFFF